MQLSFRAEVIAVEALTTEVTTAQEADRPRGSGLLTDLFPVVTKFIQLTPPDQTWSAELQSTKNVLFNFPEPVGTTQSQPLMSSKMGLKRQLEFHKVK